MSCLPRVAHCVVSQLHYVGQLAVHVPQLVYIADMPIPDKVITLIEFTIIIRATNHTHRPELVHLLLHDEVELPTLSLSLLE